jgi:ethanolamine utilization protein EutN
VLLAQVVGTAVATVKHASMDRQKLLVVQPMLADGNQPDGDPFIAIDCIGAGVGESVILTSDGRYAREWLGVNATPVRWAVIGIADEKQSRR